MKKYRIIQKKGKFTPQVRLFGFWFNMNPEPWSACYTLQIATAIIDDDIKDATTTGYKIIEYPIKNDA